MNTFTKYATANNKTEQIYPIGNVPVKPTMSSTTEGPVNYQYPSTTGGQINYLYPSTTTGGQINYPIPSKTMPVVQCYNNDQWLLIPSSKFNCQIYVKGSIYDMAISTNLKYQLMTAYSIMEIYATKYNGVVRGYLTGFTNVNNFKIEATVESSTPFNIIIYFENGLLNVVANNA